MSYQQIGPQGFRLLPPVVKNLLILNGLLFVATYILKNATGIDLVSHLGLRYPGSDAFSPYQFITYMFMHGSPPHILFNMFALWMFGYTLENIWGSKRFLTFYLVTGIGAAIVHYAVYYYQLRPFINEINEVINNASYENLVAFHNAEIAGILRPNMGDIYFKYTQFLATMRSLQLNPENPALLESARGFMMDFKTFRLNLPNVIGASGAVFGILLAFGMLFPNVKLYLYFLFPVKAKWFVIAYGLLELYFGVTQQGGNIAHFAHLGGMIFGYFMIIYWKQKRIY